MIWEALMARRQGTIFAADLAPMLRDHLVTCRRCRYNRRGRCREARALAATLAPGHADAVFEVVFSPSTPGVPW